MYYMKNVIEVVGAAFIEGGKIFAAKRSYGSSYVVHKYEFVGGKVERGERGEAALVRECKEELGLDIKVVRLLGVSEYEYPDKVVKFAVYLCKMCSCFTVKEHEECCWIAFEDIDEERWAPADRGILRDIVHNFLPEYSLVTGATGGLGRAFCFELASRGQDLFLTGRSGDKLAALARELAEKYPDIAVRACACDLTDEQSRAALFDELEGYTFSRLVNVAGADIQKAFVKYDEAKLTFQTRVLFEGAVSLTLFCLGRRASAMEIINISSVCGEYPMPYFAVYSSLKGALTDFSVALSRELKGCGVTVTAVLPGAVYTRPDVIEYIKAQGLWGRIAAKPPAYVASKSLDAAARGKVRYVPGAANKLLRAFTALLPERLLVAFIASRWKKTQKDAF